MKIVIAIIGLALVAIGAFAACAGGYRMGCSKDAVSARTIPLDELKGILFSLSIGPVFTVLGVILLLVA